MSHRSLFALGMLAEPYELICVGLLAKVQTPGFIFTAGLALSVINTSGDIATFSLSKSQSNFGNLAPPCRCRHRGA